MPCRSRFSVFTTRNFQTNENFSNHEHPSETTDDWATFELRNCFNIENKNSLKANSNHAPFLDKICDDALSLSRNLLWEQFWVLVFLLFTTSFLEILVPSVKFCFMLKSFSRFTQRRSRSIQSLGC